jgi:hypothetical protein
LVTAVEDSSESAPLLAAPRIVVRRVCREFTLLDLILAVSMSALVLAVHDVGYMLAHPFWLDEAWVADSTKARIGLTPFLSSSTPLGWTFLLRIVPFGGPQRLRLVPLAFTMLATGAAYLLGRELRMTRYSTGILLATGVLLSPAMLLRDDLKQYTAEAFATLLILLMVTRVENTWTRGRLAAIAAAGSVGMLIANTAVIVGAVALVGLALECALRRSWRRLADVAVAGLALVAAAFPIFLLVDQPKMSSALTTYWDSFYLRGSAGALISSLHADLDALAPAAGFQSLPLDAALVLAGIGVLLIRGRIALAVTLPLILVTNISASLARLYPFGDLRTSTYWLVAVPVFGGIAAVAAAQRMNRFDRRLPAVAIALSGAFWLATTAPSIRVHTLGDEDVRSQASYVAQHYRPGDVILIDYGASWGFAYYYRGAKPSFVHNPTPANGFVPTYPQAPWIVLIKGRSTLDVASALSVARGRQTSGRIWIVTSHLQEATDEEVAWGQDLSRSKVTVIRVGPEPLVLYRV